MKIEFGDGSKRKFRMELRFPARVVMPDADEMSDDDALDQGEQRLSGEGVQEVLSEEALERYGMSVVENFAEEGEATVITDADEASESDALDCEEQCLSKEGGQDFVDEDEAVDEEYRALITRLSVKSGVPIDCGFMEQYGTACFSGRQLVTYPLRGNGSRKIRRSLQGSIES